MLINKESVLWDTELAQPYASIWSIWLHILSINVDTYASLFGKNGLFSEEIKNSIGSYDNKYGIEGLSINIKEWIYDFVKNDETIVIPKYMSYTMSEELPMSNESLMNSMVHICPKCAKYGYHSYLHQFKIFKKCFIHTETELVKTSYRYSLLKGDSYEDFIKEYGFGNWLDLLHKKDIFREHIPVLRDLSYMKDAVLFIPGIRDVSYTEERFLDFLLGRKDGKVVSSLTIRPSRKVKEQFAHSLLKAAKGKAKDISKNEKECMPRLLSNDNTVEYLIEYVMYHQLKNELSNKEADEVHKLYFGKIDNVDSSLRYSNRFKKIYMKICLLTKLSCAGSPYDMETGKYVFTSRTSIMHSDLAPYNINVSFIYSTTCGLIKDIAKKQVLETALAQLESYMNDNDVDILAYNKYHNDWSFLDLPLYIIYTVEDKICLMEI